MASTVVSMGSMRVDPPQGVTEAWRLWRHCLCRYGAYPLIVAPIVTIGCLLEVYSTASCEFVNVNVGFTPSNEAWSEATADLGLFMYKNSSQVDVGLKAAFNGGCASYPEDFDDFFIAKDRTWSVSRLMAIIAGCAGGVAMVTAWLLNITPIPASFFWPGVLLPSVLVSFLTGGAKFLLFDTQICQGRLWTPIGDNETIAAAESCTLGRSGQCAIAAGCVNFLCILLVCLKAPVKRNLSSDFGRPKKYLGDVEGDTEGLRSDRMYHSPHRDYPDEVEGYITTVSAPRRFDNHDESISYLQDSFNDEFVKDLEQPVPKVVSQKSMQYNDMLYPMKSPAYSIHSAEMNRSRSMSTKPGDNESLPSLKSAKSAPQLDADRFHGVKKARNNTVSHYPDHLTIEMKREVDEPVIRYPEYLNVPELKKERKKTESQIDYKYPNKSMRESDVRDELTGKTTVTIDKSEKRDEYYANSDGNITDSTVASASESSISYKFSEEVMDETSESSPDKKHQVSEERTKAARPQSPISKTPLDKEQASNVVVISDNPTISPKKPTIHQKDEDDADTHNDELIDKCVSELRKSFGAGEVQNDDYRFTAY